MKDMTMTKHKITRARDDNGDIIEDSYEYRGYEFGRDYSVTSTYRGRYFVGNRLPDKRFTHLHQVLAYIDVLNACNNVMYNYKDIETLLRMLRATTHHETPSILLARTDWFEWQRAVQMFIPMDEATKTYKCKNTGKECFIAMGVKVVRDD